MTALPNPLAAVHRCVLLLAGCLMSLSGATGAQTAMEVWTTKLPEQAPYRHNGVASCATSACHGKVAPVEGRNVWLNEYHLWSTQDRHARAYQTLMSEKSRAMASRLGLPNAHTAEACLACHSDNVPARQRGAKFQISDGVGCEACHGGSEQWLKSHTQPNVSHADNIAQGLYPTDNPHARAALCLGCHQGAQNKFADHQMMAAGHPRLTFELDTFTVNQPGHYKVDADYRARKGEPAAGYLWLTGQLAAGTRALALIETHGGTLTAKSLAVYDCHSCHRPMRGHRGQPNDFSRQLPPGSLRLADHTFDMISAAVAVLWPSTERGWSLALGKLQAANLSPADLGQVTGALKPLISDYQTKLSAKPPSLKQLKALRQQLVDTGETGAYDDFASAEQVFLALESLTFGIGDRARLLTALDKLYNSVDNEYTFEPDRFNRALTGLKKQL